MSSPELPSREASRVYGLLDAFRSRFGREATWVSEAPGRVNLIGEHTDYNQGLVLPAAIDRTTLMAGAISERSSSRIWSSSQRDEAVFDASGPERKTNGYWGNYVAGSAWALHRNGRPISQLDLVIESDVPAGAGLSSSAALEVASVAIFAEASGYPLSSGEIARLAHKAEVEFVGVPCGIMDQFASALGEGGAALLIDCRSEEVETIPLGLEARGVRLAIVESGVSRKLAGSAYQERREECREACRFLRGPLAKGVTSLRDVSLEDLAMVGDQLPPVLRKRALHVVSENLRVLEFVSALRDCRLDDAGALMFDSHRSLRDDYEVSCQELDLLVELAEHTSGVLGARLTGAGFGGCTVNLVEEEALERFERKVVDEYQSRTGRKAKLHVCVASRGVRTAKL